MEFDNGLTKAQAERVALLLEEAGEVVQVCGKILRHGLDSFHPDRPAVTNRKMLERELGDLLLAQELMCEDDLDEDEIAQAALEKRHRVMPYLHHNTHLL